MKKVQTKNEQFDVFAWDYEIEVVKTRAAWERWKGITLTWRSATVELGRRIWMAHKALGGGHTLGRKKNVPVGQKNVPVGHSITEFIEQIGISKTTFYRFIKRIDTMVEEGIPIQELSGDMKLVEAAAPKSQQEVELEEKIALQEEEIKGRDRAIESFKKSIRVEKIRVKNSKEEIEKLKAESEKIGKPDPALQKRIAELEKREKKLSEEVDWLDTAASFKNELRALLSAAEEMMMLGKRVLRPKAKQSGK